MSWEDVATNDRKAVAGEPQPRRWTFGAAALDERTLELVVNGAAVSVERKPLEVLLFLLHHAGEVVTKDEILEAVWPGRILSETVLTKSIAKIREALGDGDSRIIKTQHGYGYRLIAPVQVEASSAPPPPRFDFKPGDHPQGRPQWSLVERLGTGGHGEAWLARHDKTREARVYKFALDSTALGSLKREITLYRLLHDALGQRADYVRILDWNLEDPPYFLEAEHAGLNLVQWAESKGGLANVPLETRLEIAARIADALAAAHSVGVLHKDLKPSNVLIVDADPEPPQVKLSDFGSGGVLDPGRLEALGITRLGFTRTVAATGTTSGTPIYFAPEVIAGQPFTVQADIYALGVMLYQLVVGDLKKALAPGWERDVQDRFLREDIAGASDGSPAQRLTDAGILARSLRRLEQRHAERREQEARAEHLRQEQARAERLRETQRRLARTRWTAAVTATLAIAALAGAFTAYQARKEAELSARTARAVNDFLTRDLLTVGSISAGVDYRALLDNAAKNVGSRFSELPEAAIDVHFVLARQYEHLGDPDRALAEMSSALAIHQRLPGSDDERLTRLVEQLAWALYGLGRFEQAEEKARQAHGVLERLYGRRHPRTLLIRTRLGRLWAELGRHEDAIRELESVIEDLRAVPPLDGPTADAVRLAFGVAGDRAVSGIALIDATARRWLAAALLEQERPSEAERLARESKATLDRELGSSDLDPYQARVSLADALTAQGRYDEAERELVDATAAYDRLLVENDYLRHVPRLAWARLHLGRREQSRAEAMIEQAAALCAARPFCTPAVAQARERAQKTKAP